MESAQLCGNGVIDPDEDCDLGTLNGQTCLTQGLTQGFAHGTLACGAGCTFDTSKCNIRYVGNGDGTLTDNQTRLQWKKKTGTPGEAIVCPGGAPCGNPHDVNNIYTWSDTGSAPDGKVFTDFVVALNTSGLAGHDDWRLPTITELQTILLEPFPCGASPCIGDLTFGPTQPAAYWSSTAHASIGDVAWLVYFNNGDVYVYEKEFPLFARAVRTLP